RAVMNELFSGMEDGKVDSRLTLVVASRNRGASLGLRPTLFGVSRSVLRREHGRALELMTEMIETTLLPEHEQQRQQEKVIAKINALPSEAQVAQLMIPRLDEIVAVCQQKTAEVRSLMVLLAVERYRLKKGKWPGKLDDLKPDFLAAVPLDP